MKLYVSINESTISRYLEEIFDIENEIHSTVKEMQDLKKEEDSVNTDLELYKNDIYQFKRMLSHIFIGPPFGGDIEGGSDIGVQMDAINRLRHDQPEFHCSTDSEDEAHTKEYDLEAIARPYLDPNVEFDFKKTTADTNNICEIDSKLTTHIDLNLKIWFIIQNRLMFLKPTLVPPPTQCHGKDLQGTEIINVCQHELKRPT